MNRVGQRRCCAECGTVVDSDEMTLVSGDVTIDRALKTVTYRGRPVKLSRQPFAILELMMLRENRIVQRFAFYVSVLDEEVDDRIIDVQISRIRTAFRKVDPTFDRIATHRGEGFRWTKPGEIAAPTAVAA